jgi:hypothetical protein
MENGRLLPWYDMDDERSSIFEIVSCFVLPSSVEDASSDGKSNSRVKQQSYTTKLALGYFRCIKDEFAFKYSSGQIATAARWNCRMWMIKAMTKTRSNHEDKNSCWKNDL